MTSLKELVALVNDAEEDGQNSSFELAAKKLGRAAELAKGLNKPRLLSVIFMRLGNTFQAADEVQFAIGAYELGFIALTEIAQLDLEKEFKAMFREAVGKRYEAIALSEAVNISADLYTPQTEKDLFTAAEDPLLISKTLINIGNAYLHSGQPIPAEDRYKTALKRPEIETAHDLRAMVHTHLGLIYVRSSKLDEATHHLEDALQAFEAAGTSAAEQRKVQAVLASLRFKQGEINAAINLYEMALSLNKDAGDDLGQQRTLVNLAHIYLTQKQFSKAQPLFEKAKALTPTRRDQQVLGYLHWGLGRCLLETGQIKESISAFESSLTCIDSVHSKLGTDEGKVAFLDGVQEVFESLIEAEIALIKNTGSFARLLDVIDRSKGLSFQDLLESRRSLSREANQSILLQDDEAFPFNPAEQTAPHTDLDFRPMMQMASNIASDSLPIFFEPEEPAEEIELRPPPTDRPMGRLVTYSLPEKLIIIAVSTDGTLIGHITPIDEDELAKRVQALLKALDADIPPHIAANRYMGRRQTGHQSRQSYVGLLRLLYNQLIKPVEQALPKDGSPIVVEPHGALWLLPFGALTAEDGTSLIDQAPLLSIPAFPILKEIREEDDYGDPNSLKTLIVGNPAYPQFIEAAGAEYQMNPLPGATIEANQIAALLNPSCQTMLEPEAATASKVETMLDEHQIIHLATHGIAFADNPNDSFLAFAQGDDNRAALTVRDVMRQSIRADLVTLSACQTGLGKISGDGMLGLGRAFLAVGARSVLVSLWNVSDKATAELMARFYQHYLERDDKALALQKAITELRTIPEYNHPQFWAPFVLIGADM